MTSVAGKIGAVTLSKSDVGLGDVDNTADVDKPISVAVQTVLDTKVTASALPGLVAENAKDSTGRRLDSLVVAEG
ncbi:MAG: hypothetical protein WBP22_04610 [Candidatus Saccharimonas sp.]